MTPAEHKSMAEQLLVSAENIVRTTTANADTLNMAVNILLAKAQVHATLATLPK